MSWGVIQIGRLTVAEKYDLSEQINAGTQERTIQISGQQFTGQYGAIDTDAHITRRQENVLGLADTIVPVVFQNKTAQNGFYKVHDVGADLLHWPNEITSFNWSMILSKFGPDNAVDIESRLGTVVRANNFSLTGERWHAPPIGHYGYYTGPTLPSTMTRTGVDGAITIYRSIPSGINPRWGCPVASYMLGRVRILTDGYERNGVGIRATATNWELNNGLVKVIPLTSSGMLRVSAWSGSAWEDKAWNIAKGGATTALGNFDQASVIRNEPEICTIRLLRVAAPGRTLVDLTLRRGSRLVEVYVQTDTSTTLGLFLQTTETATDNTAASGYVVATNNDADGNKFIVGSSKTVSYTANQGISKATTTTFDGYMGVVFDGTSAVAGDAATVLRDQYIGALSESIAAVKR